MPRSARPAYSRGFAEYYDALYEGLVNYEADVDFLERVFRRFRARPTTILDLGCGTGNHDFPLAAKGYQVTGIDQSEAMLSLARKKTARAGRRPRFVRADMATFQLQHTFDAAICMFGAFGYLVDRRAATRCLRNVREHLTSDGLFVFEYWQTSGVRPRTQSWIERASGRREIIRLSDSRFDSRHSTLAMDFQFLVVQGHKLLDRFSERHVVRTYSRRQLADLVRRTGFDLIGEFDATPQRKTFRRVTSDAFRIMAVVRVRSES